MKFDEFWNILIKELKTKQTYTTLKQPQKFDAFYSYNQIIITPHSTRRPRKPTKANFKMIWKSEYSLNPDERYDVSSYKQTSGNASYILTLIKIILDDQEMQC